MLYTLKLFGIFEDKIGSSTLELSSSKELTVSNLKKDLHARYSIFDEVKSYMLAVNEAYCDDDSRILLHDDEIALIPPIAGG